MMGVYSWRVKSGPSGQIGEMMPVGTFEGCEDVVHRLLKRDQLLTCFLLNLTKINPTIQNAMPNPLSSFPVPKSAQRGSVEIGETKVELRTQAVKDLEELLRRKTEQVNNYGHVIAPKSSYYYHGHQMQLNWVWA